MAEVIEVRQKPLFDKIEIKISQLPTAEKSLISIPKNELALRSLKN